MNILRAVPGYKLTNNGQVSRRDRYRTELKVTEQDRKDHLAIDWNAAQTPSQLVKRDGDKYTLSNFRWGFSEVGKNDEWVPRTADTTIDASKVKDVYLALEPFFPEVVAGHGLLVFEMEEDGAVQSADGQKDFGFALSIEARRPKGMEYGLVSGMKKNFGMIYQMGSLSDQMQKVTRQRGHKLVLHRLELDKEQKTKLIHEGLNAAVEDRVGEWYHTLTNSCYTGDVDLINEVVPDSQKMARWSKHLKFARLATALPALGGATLKQKGLLADEPITFLQPNPELYPDKQTEVKGIKAALGQASRSSLWKPSFAVAGAGVGGALGYAIGSSFGQVGSLVGAAGGLLTGLYAGDRSADIIAVKTDQKAFNALEWYAQKGGITLEEAASRVSNSDRRANALLTAL
jgi:hypothetical protein